MAINKQCAYYCIDVIRCLMQEKTVPPIPDGMTLRELFDFSKLHNVEAMVSHGLEQLDMDENDPVWQNWQNRAAMILTQSVVQLAERDALFQALPEAGIKLLPIKGCWMKELYPDIDWRQMSDLDMLIPPEKSPEARKLLLSMGYSSSPHDDEPNHASYFKGEYTKIELHVSLLHEDIDYYKDVWQRTHPVDQYPGLYRFSPEDEYIYYLLHLHQHLTGSGTGIRTILDSLVYRNIYPNMDREYLERELKKFDLWDVTLKIEQLAEHWFLTGAPVPEELAELADSVLSAGSYGTLDNHITHRMEAYERKYKNRLVRMIAYAINRTCRPRKEMEHSYPILKKLPFLLPFFWLLRAILRFSKNYKVIWYQLVRMFKYRGSDHES